MKTTDRLAMLELSAKYETDLRRSEEEGTLEITTAAMAHALQAQLGMPGSCIRYAPALDVIMRAVAHTIEGGPSMNRYVLEKLGLGHQWLISWMKDEAE